MAQMDKLTFVKWDNRNDPILEYEVSGLIGDENYWIGIWYPSDRCIATFNVITETPTGTIYADGAYVDLGDVIVEISIFRNRICDEAGVRKLNDCKAAGLFDDTMECYIPPSPTKPPIQGAKGKIIAHNINKLPCPNCGEATEGQEIEVIMGMKNVGDTDEEFRFYIYDQDGNELSKEPDYSYKNVKAGDTWRVSKTLLTNLNFDMINKTLNGRVELVRQT